MGLTLAIDFGSTYTKAVAVDLDKEELIGVAQSPSTVNTDMTIALHNALEKLRVNVDAGKINAERVIASSSAAGGLKVVAIGLVRALTTKAAEEAALGAGAKLIGTYSYGLSPADIIEIEQVAPDMILLAGGTDGGNSECIIHNAGLVAKSNLKSPIIIAGNKRASQEARTLLDEGGKYNIIVDNVLPELEILHVEPTRSIMRETFMQRIIHGKGLDRAQALIGDIIMPTPTAVLNGARLLAEGTDEEIGMGELVVVDVGGATTDVDSIAHGHPSNVDALFKGLPEPYMKRTVEGDLGIRYNAETIFEKVGKKDLMERLSCINKPLAEKMDIEASVKHLSSCVDTVPQDENDFCIDIALSCAAVDIAIGRHCGKIEEVYFPTGNVRLQHGKDLMEINNIIGTGGIFAYGRDSRRVLEAGCYNVKKPESLRPRKPEFYIDEFYILYAIGLLSEISPTAALRIMKSHLKKV
ncbi:methylaspartate mutase accessory protein GlmL [Chloroflexota bacterium]